MNLSDLQDKAAKCGMCELAKTRKVAVFAKGNPYSKILVCGMCPGPDENHPKNEMGWPFVGRAGKHLDEILEDTNLTQRDVYITNVVKCFLRPGIRLDDRCVDKCMPYMIEQIGAIEPKVVLALGADAGRALLNKSTSTSLASMRGKRYKFTENISIIVTYHPSYFLRQGGRKHDHYDRIIDDIEWVKEIINR